MYYLASGVEKIEFQCVLIVIIPYVGVMVVFLHLTKFPPAVGHTRCVSVFSGLILHTILA